MADENSVPHPNPHDLLVGVGGREKKLKVVSPGGKKKS